MVNLYWNLDQNFVFPVKYFNYSMLNLMVKYFKITKVLFINQNLKKMMKTAIKFAKNFEINKNYLKKFLKYYSIKNLKLNLIKIFIN